MAKMARDDRTKIKPKKSDDATVIVIQHPGFCNPNAITNEQFREERLVENQMRGGWSEAEARQMLRDKGRLD